MLANSGMCLTNASPHSANQDSSLTWSKLFDNSCSHRKMQARLILTLVLTLNFNIIYTQYIVIKPTNGNDIATECGKPSSAHTRVHQTLEFVTASLTLCQKLILLYGDKTEFLMTNSVTCLLLCKTNSTTLPHNY